SSPSAIYEHAAATTPISDRGPLPKLIRYRVSSRRQCGRDREDDVFDLTGRVAVVTGGNGGIGLGMARGLAAAGAGIVVAARNRAKSEAAAAELARLGGRAEFIPLDVADSASCRAMMDAVVDRFGRLDILVNNAGMSIRKPPE